MTGLVGSSFIGLTGSSLTGLTGSSLTGLVGSSFTGLTGSSLEGFIGSSFTGCGGIWSPLTLPEPLTICTKTSLSQSNPLVAWIRMLFLGSLDKSFTFVSYSTLTIWSRVGKVIVNPWSVSLIFSLAISLTIVQGSILDMIRALRLPLTYS